MGVNRPAFPFLITAFLAAPLCSSAAVDFAHQIVPILRKHCAECHSGDKLKGGFSMNDRAALLHGSENGAVVDLKQVEKSVLLEVVATQDEDLRMPPKGAGLSAAEAALLRQWISEGVPWEAGFAFKAPAYEPPLKPRRVELPVSSTGLAHPVDRLLEVYLQKHQQPWPKRLSDGAFLRRAQLDLIGLLPTPEAVAAFAADQAPDKRSRLVRSLLARDVDYTEHWLTFWNDLLRNDYGGTGFITGGRKQISKWLYESLINNKPFDVFARELISPPNDDSRGFIDGIQWRGDVSAGQTVEIQFAQSVGQSFLGINLKCASCHDSFIDRWKLDEAYGLAAIYAEKPLEIHRCDKPVGRTAKASWLFPEIGQVDAAAPRPERLRQLAALLTHPENGRFSRTIVNRLWHRLMGHGLVHPLDSMQSPPWNEDLLDALAMRFQDEGYDLKKLIEHIATSKMYESQSVVALEENEEAFVFRSPVAKRLTAEQFMDALWQITGEAPGKLDAPVFRAKLDPQTAGKVSLKARWIWGDSAAGGKVPPADESILLRKTIKLAAAPAAGSAVISCDNEFKLFINGKRVTGSDDWTHFSSVALHDKMVAGDNQIVLVATNAGKGPNPAGLWFQAQLKLTDGSAVSITSDADWQFSPSVPAGKEGRLGALPKNFKSVTLVKAVGSWTQAANQQAPALLAMGEQSASRMVRAALVKSDFLMRSLGRPNRDQIVSMRPTDLTTLEALDLANGETLTNALNRGAEKLTERTWKDGAELVHWVYHHALARDPSAGELAAATELLGAKPSAEGTADLLWSVMMQPEFLFVR